MTIKQQMDLDHFLINMINKELTQALTLQEDEIFRNFVLGYIDIWGEDDFQTDVMPQLFNVYFIDIAKEILNDSGDKEILNDSGDIK